MNACKQVADIIGPYLYEEATEQETAMLEEHLKSCECCRLDIARRREAIASLVPAAPTAEERVRIMRMVRTRIASDPVRRRASRAFHALRWASAVALASFLFVCGIWIGQHHASPRQVVKIVKVTAPSVREPAPQASVPRVRVEAPKTETKRMHHKRITHQQVQKQQPLPRLHVRPRVEQVHEASYPIRVVVAPVPSGMNDVRLAAVEERRE